MAGRSRGMTGGQFIAVVVVVALLFAGAWVVERSPQGEVPLEHVTDGGGNGDALLPEEVEGALPPWLR